MGYQQKASLYSVVGAAALAVLGCDNNSQPSSLEQKVQAQGAGASGAPRGNRVGAQSYEELDLSTPEATMDTYVRLLYREVNGSGAYNCLTHEMKKNGELSRLYELDSMPQSKKDAFIKDWSGRTFVKHVTKLDEGSSTIKLEVREGKISKTETFKLQKIGNEWYISGL